MQISHELTRHVLVISLFGELDHHAAHGAITYISRQISLNRTPVVELDLGGITFLDSSALAVAVNAKRAAERNSGTLVIRNASAQAMKIFRAARLDKLISFQ